MRVLIISTSVVPIGQKRYGGIEKLCGDFVEGLKEAGQDVTVAAPVGSKIPDGVKLIETVKLPEEQDDDALAFLRMDENSQHGWVSYDILHDFSHKHILGQKNLQVLPTVSMFWHPMIHKYKQAKYNAVCLSDWQRQRFEKLYGQKAIVMPMCVDVHKYKPTPNPSRERFLFLGKISPEKGVHLAVKYCKELGASLDIVGGLIPSEQNSPYLQTIQKLCDGDKIKLHFNVTEEEKIGFLQNAKAVIYPVQQEEAHWLVGIEASACGTMTITFDVGSFQETVYGFVVRSEEDFKRTMGHMEWMKDLQPDMWAQTNHSKEVVIPKYLKLYQDVANGLRW